MNLLYIENYILSHYNIENGHSTKTSDIGYLVACL